jgi:hypothetical protein
MKPPLRPHPPRRRSKPRNSQNRANTVILFSSVGVRNYLNETASIALVVLLAISPDSETPILAVHVPWRLAHRSLAVAEADDPTRWLFRPPPRVHVKQVELVMNELIQKLTQKQHKMRRSWCNPLRALHQWEKNNRPKLWVGVPPLGGMGPKNRLKVGLQPRVIEVRLRNCR